MRGEGGSSSGQQQRHLQHTTAPPHSSATAPLSQHACATFTLVPFAHHPTPPHPHLLQDC